MLWIGLLAAAIGGCTQFSRPPVDHGHWANRYDDSLPIPLRADAAQASGALLTASATPPRRDDKEKATFFWHYAALAASIYGTEGLEDSSLLLTVTSPYLRKELAQAEGLQDLDRVNGMNDAEAFKWLRRRCGASEGRAVRPSYLCGVYQRYRDTWAETMVEESSPEAEDTMKMKDEVPRLQVAALTSPDASPSDRAEDCTARNPKVPLSVAMSEMGWERAKEIDKYSLGRGWRVFVPDLAIDVWRRKRPEFHGVNAVEYAIVFRGTVGSGGWLTNLRIVTGMLPGVFWDQYLQAESATAKIVDQIYTLHSVRDSLLPGKPPSRVLITAVGHSLGAGLASYVHYKIPAVTRVVGFNPTPIDGSRSLVKLPQRTRYFDRRAGLEPLDVDPIVRAGGKGFDKASMYLIYEKGEILSRLDSCNSGPVWGSEGGPTVLCERVNLSSGSIFRQHSMPQLACKLALEAGIGRHPERPGMSARNTSSAR